MENLGYYTRADDWLSWFLFRGKILSEIRA